MNRKAKARDKVLAGLIGTLAALGFLALGSPLAIPLTVLAAVEVGGGLGPLLERD